MAASIAEPARVAVPAAAPAAVPAAASRPAPSDGHPGVPVGEIDAAVQVLRGQPGNRPIHCRQIADMAVKRRLLRADTPESWRAIRVALLHEQRRRLASGQRPRARYHGSGLFSWSEGALPAGLQAAEAELAVAADQLARATAETLRLRLARLAPAAFHILSRVLLERSGHQDLQVVSRSAAICVLASRLEAGAAILRFLVLVVAGEAAPSPALIAETAELATRRRDDGLLVLCAGAAPASRSVTTPAAGPPVPGTARVSLLDGQAVAELCLRAEVGVLSPRIPPILLDIDFLAELEEG